MLHVVQSAARPASDAVLRSMFAARKSVFVDLLKWDVPVLDGRYEIDQFDDVHATYLILANPDGTHLGSARLLPTTRPHILDSFYAELSMQNCATRRRRRPPTSSRSRASASIAG